MEKAFVTQRTTATTGEIISWGSESMPVPQVLDEFHGQRVKNIFGGTNRVFALLNEGEICVLTEAPDEEHDAIDKILADVPIEEVAAGAGHYVARAKDGAVFCWGKNKFGQCGVFHTETVVYPTLVESLKGKKVVQVACGDEFSCAVTDEGDLYTWGRGFEGQTGHGLTPVVKPAEEKEESAVEGFIPRVHSAPKFVGGLLGWKVLKVSCGGNFITVIAKKGDDAPPQLFAWGNGSLGQLGLGRVTVVETPTRLEKFFDDASSKSHEDPKGAGAISAEDCEPDGFTDIASGWGHTIAVGASGTVYSWGFNGKGQLGLGDLESRYFPHRIPTVSPQFQFLDRVGACSHYSCAVTVSGVLFTWGCAIDGRLGIGPVKEESVPSPTQVLALSNFPVNAFVCSERDMFVFSETRLLQLRPSGGLTGSDTRIALQGTSMYRTTEGIVRFSLNGVEKKIVAEFNPLTGFLECTAPKFEDAGGNLMVGDAQVEVALDGVTFTSDGNTFVLYDPPVITKILPGNVPANGGTTVVLEGTGLEACNGLGQTRQIRVRIEPKKKNRHVPAKSVANAMRRALTWMSMRDLLDPLAGPDVHEVAGSYRERLVSSEELRAAKEASLEGLSPEELERALEEEESEDDGEDRLVPVGQILFLSPEIAMKGKSLMEMQLTLSLNGQDFTSIDLPFVAQDVAFDAIKPTFVRAQGGTAMQLRGRGFQRTEDLVVRFKFADQHVDTKGVFKNDFTITFDMPRVPRSVMLAAYKMHLKKAGLGHTEAFGAGGVSVVAHIQLCFNGIDFQPDPPYSKDHGISLLVYDGVVDTIKPNAGSYTGGASVELHGSGQRKWLFHTSAARVLFANDRFSEAVPAKFDTEKRCYVCTAPALPPPPKSEEQAPEEGKEEEEEATEDPPAEEAEEGKEVEEEEAEEAHQWMGEEVSLSMAFNGVHFLDGKALKFNYFVNPTVKSMTPTSGDIGTTVTLTAENLLSFTTVYVRFTNGCGWKKVVEASMDLEAKTITAVVPELEDTSLAKTSSLEAAEMKNHPLAALMDKAADDESVEVNKVTEHNLDQLLAIGEDDEEEEEEEEEGEIEQKTPVVEEGPTSSSPPTFSLEKRKAVSVEFSYNQQDWVAVDKTFSLNLEEEEKKEEPGEDVQ